MACQPNLPTTKAMAPNAPKGADSMTRRAKAKIKPSSFSMARSSGSPAGPSRSKAKAVSSETNSTCTMSPEVKAPTSVSGMMPRRKPDTVCWAPLST